MAKSSADPFTSGRWMSKLKSHAEKMNYPGIKIEHAILQAEYQIMLKDYESAKETLMVVLRIHDCPSVKSLTTTIQEKITLLNKMI